MWSHPNLGQLSQLQWLSLYGNKLTGSIPSELGRLSQLEWLDLSGNVLIGSIPPELSQLIALRGLYLYGNELIGSIPLELSQLTALRGLRLDNNGLTGVIPPALGRLTELEELNLDGNALIGCAPETLARWVNDLPVCSQVSKSFDAAVSAVTATVLGDAVESLIVEFARTIPGRQPDYAWSDGTSPLLLSPMELLEKLAALVPPPRFHLLRYHGVLAPRARARDRIVPAQPVAEPSAADGSASAASCGHRLR